MSATWKRMITQYTIFICMLYQTIMLRQLMDFLFVLSLMLQRAFHKCYPSFKHYHYYQVLVWKSISLPPHCRLFANLHCFLHLFSLSSSVFPSHLRLSFVCLSTQGSLLWCPAVPLSWLLLDNPSDQETFTDFPGTANLPLLWLQIFYTVCLFSGLWNDNFGESLLQCMWWAL